MQSGYSIFLKRANGAAYDLERDSHVLAAHIVRLLQDEPFWQACSTRAAVWMEERFDLVKQTQELEQIYSSLLK
jgi:hypothetical protein